MPYFTEKEMNEKEMFYAFGCIGGMAEGFDYSEWRALCHYWAEQRAKYGYGGGECDVITGEQALALYPEYDRRQKT